MSIKEKLEKAKEKAKGRLEKAKRKARKAAMIAGVGAITVGGMTSCGEENATKATDSQENKTELVKKKSTFEKAFEEGEDFPLRKQAENPKNPDSLLVEITYDVCEDGHYKVTPKYVPIDKEDKDKDFLPEITSPATYQEILGKEKIYYDTIPEYYDVDGKHPQQIKEQRHNYTVVRSVLKQNISYTVKDKKVKSDTSKTETSAQTEARETPEWMGEPVSPARPHGDSENKSESSKKANKKILDKIAKQKRER